MKRTTKHVALDVHQATTVASVREVWVKDDGPGIRETANLFVPSGVLRSAGRLDRHTRAPEYPIGRVKERAG